MLPHFFQLGHHAVDYAKRRADDHCLGGAEGERVDCRCRMSETEIVRR